MKALKTIILKPKCKADRQQAFLIVNDMTFAVRPLDLEFRAVHMTHNISCQ